MNEIQDDEVQADWCVDEKTGLISGVPFINSPHQDERPINESIDLIVIHNISLPPNEFDEPENVIQFFKGELDTSLHPYFEKIKHLRVSSHCIILRTGEVIQMVPLHKRAWHAGQSNFKDRTSCNDFSIGIELIGSDFHPFTTEQYQSLIKLTKLLLNVYSRINLERIVGHSDIAPKRKTDPGPCFDWKNYLSKLTL